jgi:transcriptional regulator with XRE-family HTH domain
MSRAGAQLVDTDWASARLAYAQELAEQRKRSGLSLVALSHRCRYEQSYLHRLETGGRIGTVEAAAALDRVYGTGTLLVRLWHLAKQEAKRYPFFGLAPLEATAISIQEFAPFAMPELLQTPAYTREQLSNAGPHEPKQLAAQIEARTRRQDRLTNGHSIHYRAVLDESVLQRKSRTGPTWTAQLDHLITIAGHPEISLQILPLGTGPRGLPGPLELLYLPDGRTLAYAQSCWSGHLIDDPEDVQPLRLAYDLLRDSALTPTQSLAHLCTLRRNHASRPQRSPAAVMP